MEQVNALAKALKSELHVRSRALEITTDNGKKIRTICRITVEWAPDLPDEVGKKLDRVYSDALEDIREIFSF